MPTGLTLAVINHGSLIFALIRRRPNAVQSRAMITRARRDYARATMRGHDSRRRRQSGNDALYAAIVLGGDRFVGATIEGAAR